MASINLQVQIRQNAESMRDYFADLQKWRSAITEGTAAGQTAHQCTQPLAGGPAHTAPPIGNPGESSNSRQEPPQQLHQKCGCAAVTNNSAVFSPRDPGRTRKENSLSSNYGAWDRFNVEEELNKLDVDASRTNQTTGPNEFRMAPSLGSKIDSKHPSLQPREQRKGVMRTLVKSRETKTAEAANPQAPEFVTQKTKADVEKVSQALREQLSEALTINQASLLDYRSCKYRSAASGFEACLIRLEQHSLCRSLSISADVKPCFPLISHWKKLRSIFRTNLGFAQLCLSRLGRARDCAASARCDWGESPFVQFLHAVCERSEGNYAQAGQQLHELLAYLGTEEPLKRTYESSAEGPVAMSCPTTEELLSTCLSALNTHEFGFLSATIAIISTKPESAAARLARVNVNNHENIHSGHASENPWRPPLSKEVRASEAQLKTETTYPPCISNFSGSPDCPSAVPLSPAEGYTDTQVSGHSCCVTTHNLGREGRVSDALHSPLAHSPFALKNAVFAELAEVVTLRDKEASTRRRQRQQKAWQRSHDLLRHDERRCITQERFSKIIQVSTAEQEFQEDATTRERSQGVCRSAVGREDSLVVARKKILRKCATHPAHGNNRIRKLHVHILNNNPHVNEGQAKDQMYFKD